MKALKPMLTGNLSGPSFGMDLAELANLDLDSELLSTDEEIIMDENSVDSKPKIVSITKIDFPEKALVLEISKGMVEVRLLIDKYGNVGRTQVIDATPKGVFEESTLLALQSWKFEPATYRGKNVAIWAKQVVKFGE
jgi:protein TonB